MGEYWSRREAVFLLKMAYQARLATKQRAAAHPGRIQSYIRVTGISRILVNQMFVEKQISISDRQTVCLLDDQIAKKKMKLPL